MSKSKFVVIGLDKLRKECLKRVEKNPIKIGDLIHENIASEEYLGDKIHKDGPAAIITETIKIRMPVAIAKGKEIMNICDDPRLIGFPSGIGPINESKIKIVTKLLNNSDSWLGLNESHIKTLCYGWTAKC